jgi:hypothetical protein
MHGGGYEPMRKHETNCFDSLIQHYIDCFGAKQAKQRRQGLTRGSPAGNEFN